MTKGRLEAFSDGVIAILITIMVLELKLPAGSDWGALQSMLPTLLRYALSFVLVGIYWNNHHHLLHIATRVNGRILWANLMLLFWLSLVPFATSWTSESASAPVPTAFYGAVLLLAGVSFTVLVRALIAEHGAESPVAKAIDRDVKGKLSIVLYGTAIAMAFVRPWIADALYVVVALIWFVPDRRIERRLVE